MKAMVYKGAYQVELIESPVPFVEKSDDVVLKVLGCGICGTDGHIYRGEVPSVPPATILGHEICGEVVAWGNAVDSLNSGDIVCIDPIIGCTRCSFCRSGKSNLCGNMTNIGFMRSGGFQQYTTVPASHVYPLPDRIDIKAGVLIETLACVINGYDQLNIASGSTIMILGAGSVGLLWTQLIRHGLNVCLLQTEWVENRRQTAERLGADWTINPSTENLAEAVRATLPEGLDYLIDATGSSAAIQEALPLLRKGGKLMIFGICPPREKLTITPFDMFEQELSIISSKMCPLKMDKAIKLVQSGIIDTDSIVNRIIALEELETGLRQVIDAPETGIKILVDPWR